MMQGTALDRVVRTRAKRCQGRIRLIELNQRKGHASESLALDYSAICD